MVLIFLVPPPAGRDVFFFSSCTRGLQGSARLGGACRGGFPFRRLSDLPPRPRAKKPTFSCSGLEEVPPYLFFVFPFLLRSFLPSFFPSLSMSEPFFLFADTGGKKAGVGEPL